MVQQELPRDYSALVEANTRFAFKFYRATCAEGEENSNSTIAPLLFSIGFSLLLNGASEKAQAEILKAMEFDGLSLPQVNEQNFALKEALASGQGDQLSKTEALERLVFANALWMVLPERFSLKFIERSENYFSFDLKSSPASAVQQEIAQWSAEKTEGLVTLNVDLSDFYLLFATYFKGFWKNPFPEKATYSGPFNLLDSSTKTVPMMTQAGSFPYLETSEFQLLALPCSLATVYILLPCTDSSLTRLQSSLDGPSWRSWQAALRQQSGRVTIPKVTVSYENEFTPVLRKLGLSQAFDSFQSLAPAVVNPEGAKLESVIESTVVKIDEKGAEAASVLVMTVRAGSAARKTFNFLADRPFIFLIEDNKTRSILFVGRVLEP